MISQTIKSSPEAIRPNFDQQVERFSNLETGQTTAIDSPLCLELVARSAALLNPNAKRVMDLGCGGVEIMPLKSLPYFLMLIVH